jgi:integrase
MAKPVKHYGKWRIRWIDEAGIRQSEIYDDRNDAAYKLREHEHHVEEVRRGLRSPTPPQRTVGEALDYWLAHRAAQKRSGHHDESIIRHHLRPTFGHLSLKNLDVEKIDAFVSDRSHLHKNTIHHLLTLLVSVVRMAVDLGWLRRPPKIKKPRIKLYDKDFRYLRTQGEIRRFLRAARERGDLLYYLYGTAILTGMREGELAGLRWSDIDLERRRITVARSWNGPTKSDELRIVPILDALLPLLREWRLRCPSELLFPNRDGRMFCKNSPVFQELLQRVLRDAGFPGVVRNGKARGYICFHDLRHTFASHWVAGGGDLYRLQRVLGHKSSIMTQRYAHLSPDVFVQDYGRLSSLAAGSESQVMPLVAAVDEA